MSASTYLTKYVRIEYAAKEARLKVSPADIAFFQTGDIVHELTDIVTRGQPSDLHAICMESRRAIAVIGWTIILLKRMCPWLCVDGVENSCVIFKLKIPEDKKRSFADLMKSGKLQKQLTTAFGNKEKHLEELLGQYFVCIKNIDLDKLDSVVISKLEEITVTDKLKPFPNGGSSSPTTVDVNIDVGVIEEGDRVKISWDPVADSGVYHLSIRRKGTKEEMQHHAKRSRILLNTDDFIRIGCSYEMKLTIIDDGEITESEWVTCTIGDGPKDVTAALSASKPHRWVDVSFRSPKRTPALVESYHITAIPDVGRVRNMVMKHSEKKGTFKFLRSSTKYKFEVTAVYQDGEESVGSLSNVVETSKSVDSKEEKKGKEFGQVRDAKTVPKDDDNYVISWKPPSFDLDDYQVQHFEVQVRTKQGMVTQEEQIQFRHDQSSYATKSFKLSSTNHVASIKTVYDDVELDKYGIVSTEIVLDIASGKRL